MSSDNSSQSHLEAMTWFRTPVSDIDPNVTWPWKRIDQNDLMPVLQYVDAYKSYYRGRVTDTLLWTMVGAGLLGSVLILVTIWRMPKPARTSFYNVMYAMAYLDLAFLLDIIARLRLVLVPNPSTFVYVLTFAACGTVYYVSMVSDMLTLLLTTERFVALNFPAFHKQLSDRTKRRWWTVSIAVAVVISLCRARFAFANASYSIHSVSDTRFFEVITYLGDSVLPILLSVLMLLLVVGIGRALLKRVLSKTVSGGGGQSTSTATQKHFRDSMKTMSLLGVLMVLYLTNQIGYIFYEFVYIDLTKTPISFESDLAEAVVYAEMIVYFELSNNFGMLSEVFSRALNFYTYLIFSRNFRAYFFDFLRQSRQLLGQIGGNNLSIVSTLPPPQNDPRQRTNDVEST